MLFLILILAINLICFIIVISNCLFWPQVRDSVIGYPGLVSVLIPARNEEKNIAACLESVSNQGAVVKEILVYDDFSTDNTNRIVKKYAAKNSRVALVDAVSLPIGWCGKNFACAQLAKSAQGEWLLFLDADSRLASNAINRMLAEVKKRQVTFLSCWPKFETKTLSEIILMPLLNFVVFNIYPGILSLIKRPELQYNPKLGLAHGACMLFERDSYLSFGGHETVRAQIFEDTRIAQLWRSAGRKGICLDGRSIIFLRMYSSFTEIWYGFQKNFFPGFAKEYNFWIFLSVHFVSFFFPFVMAIIYPSLWILVCCAIIILMRMLLLLRFNQSLLSALFHPMAEVVLILLGLSSWWRCKTGRGVVWKGRKYWKSL